MSYNVHSLPRAGELFNKFLLSIVEVVKERNLTPGEKGKSAKSQPPAKPKPLYGKIWDFISSLLFYILLSIFYLCQKDHAPFNTSDRVIYYFSGKEKRAAPWNKFSLRFKTWFWVNFGLCCVKWYGEKHGGGSTQRGYEFIWRFIEDALFCEGRPERTFTDVFQFVTCRKADYDWTYFDSLHGGVFTEDVRKVLTTIMQFDAASGAVFVNFYRDFTKDFPPEVKSFARDVKTHFLRNTGLQGLFDMLGREIRRFLTTYCDKMGERAKKAREVETAQKWAHASQILDQIRAKTPMPQNDAEIERLVAEFVRRANEAGSFTYATRQVDVPGKDGVELTKKTKEQIDEISKGVKSLVKDAKGKGEKNLRLPKTTLKYVRKLWEREQFEPSHYPEAGGRRITKRDVYELYRKKLAEKGINSCDDFCKAIDNSRKQAA